MGENANSLLILRCSNCDELESLLTVQVPDDDNSRLVKLWLLSKNFSPEQCQALCEWWERYSFGAVEAKDGISLVCAMVGEVEESRVRKCSVGRCKMMTYNTVLAVMFLP